jgi:hypothetical protein
MTFLSPLVLIGLALVSLPVVIHILSRRRARRLDFPTLRYLRETTSFRLRPRRLHEPWLLALRVAALALLVVAFARPLLGPRGPSRQTRLILIDASLSMRAPGRAASAREEARSIINKLAQGERAAIIAIASQASVLSQITGDRQELLAAVERYRPASDAVDFDNGLNVCRELLEREAPGTASIDIISDFQQTNLAALAVGRPSQPAARVIPHAVGATIERNAFLLDEVAWKNERGVQLSASEIISAADGREGARRVWTIDAEAGERPDINWRTETNGQLTGRLRTLAPDDFDYDDERFFAFNAPRDTRALLVETDGETNAYAGAALEAAAHHTGGSTRLARRRQLPAHAAELDAYALVVLTLHATPRAEELRLLAEYAEAGGTVWLSMARDAETLALNQLAATADGRILPFRNALRLSDARTWNISSADLTAAPLGALTEGGFQALRSVSVREGYAFEPREGADTLMRWTDGAAALVSARLGSGRVLLLGTSTESAASDLGISTAFPSLAFSILREAAAPREPLSYALGEPVDLHLAPDASVGITETSGHARQAAARDFLQTPLSVLSEPGIYRLESAQGIRFVALNTPGAESERALANANEAQRAFGLSETTASVGGDRWREAVERGGNAWRYFLGAAFLLLIGELFVRVRQRRQRAAAIERTATL